MVRLYYTPPGDKIFNEVREKSMEIWKKYDNSYGYVDEKTNQIKAMTNIEDNFMYIVSMFDLNNQRVLASMLSKEAKKEISDRMVDGGMPNEYNPFML